MTIKKLTLYKNLARVSTLLFNNLFDISSETLKRDVRENIDICSKKKIEEKK